jgi:hypothetical protein
VKFGMGEDIGTRPLLLVGVVLVIASLQFITTGVVAELLTRTYFESSRVKPYVVRRRSSTSVSWAGPAQAWNPGTNSPAGDPPASP